MKRLIAIWLVCAYINWGFILGYFTNRYPWDENISIAAFVAVGGPLGLPTSLFVAAPHHYWRLVPTTREEQWAAYHKEWPSLSCDEFDRSH